MSCCPPNSEPYLAADYKTSGKIISAGGFEFYTSGDSTGKKGLLLIPDVWGWNSGRIRNVADFFAKEGFYAIIPKVMPPLEGGTDGDGLPPNFDMAVRGAEIMPYISGNLSFATVEPGTRAALRHLVDAGTTKIAIIGICYGGWVMSKIMAGKDMPEQIVCGVSPHPSIGLEGAFGGSPAQLLSTVKRPIFLLPAGNDPDDYRPNGAFYEALKAAQPASAVSLDYGEMRHGFSIRGDVSDASVKKHVTMALDAMHKYISEQFAKAA